jgi:serine/threonine protein kinase
MLQVFRRTCDDRSMSSSNGRLWECVHRRTGRPYCVKMLRDDETEALRLAAVQPHGNICRYHDCLVHQESNWLIMDLYRDGTLSDYVLQRGRLNEEMAVLWIAQILRAVQYLHTVHRLAHGRLTPDHILLRRRRREQVGGDRDKGGDDDDGNNVELVIAGFGGSRYIDEDEDDAKHYSTSLAATAEDDMYYIGELSQVMLMGDTSVDLSNWTGLSRAAKQYLVLLLHPDPTVRLTATEALSHDFIRRPPQSPRETNDDDDEAEDHSGREVVVMDHCHPHDSCLHNPRRHAKGTLCKSSWPGAVKYTAHYDDDDDDDGRSFSLASTSSSSTSVQ